MRCHSMCPQEGVTAVIGPNGAGKTTLFNVISGFMPPSAGRVMFAGQHITGLPPDAIAKRGLVRTFQLAQLFENLTVLENVKVGRHLHTTGGLLTALMPLRAARLRDAGRGRLARACSSSVGLASQHGHARRRSSLRTETPPRDRPRARGRTQAPAAGRAGGRAQSQ